MLKYLCCVLLCACAAVAQETVNNASLSGRVADPTGAIVDAARVTARQTQTNITNETATDREGRFRFPYLPVGQYEIAVRKQGFADAIRSVRLTIGAAYDLPFTLSLGSTESSVNVSADAEILESARSQVAATVSQSEVAALPLNGRNYLDVALVAPGVSPTNTASTQLFAETSAIPGQGISIGSQRNFSNSFIVDGVSDNDDAAGVTGTVFGLDTIEEFQVVASGAQAEFGRALGGYINMVTKSGGNTFHGDAYGYFRNQRFNAANPLTNTLLPLTQAQFGASLGGPVVRDRTFYYANYEQRILNQDAVTVITPANVAAINARLLTSGYPGSLISTGLFPNPVHNQDFLARLDHEFSSTDRFTARYSLYHVESQNSRGAGGLSAVTAAAALEDLDQSLALSNIKTLSPQTVNETRGLVSYSDLNAPPNDLVGPAVSISGVATFGTLSGAPTARRDYLYEIVDNLSHQMGAHAVRMGVDFLDNDLRIVYPRSFRGSYSFSSLANFLSGAYNNSGFTQTFGASSTTQNNPNLGFYAQDEWKVLPNFTLNIGVRYDLQFVKTFSTDLDNISPRIGFAWTPFASRSTVVRGSFGMYYDRVPLRAVANALLSSNNTTALTADSQVSVSLSPAQSGAPVFPNIISTRPTGVLVNYTTMNPNIQNAYSDQLSFEIERGIGTKASVSASYQHLRGIHLIMSINQNVPACIASGSNNGCRPNPAYGNNSQYNSAADSRYNALMISFVQRPVRWGSIRVSYTYSRAYDDVSEFFFSGPINPYNVWQDWGRSDDDQRHRVVVEGATHYRGFQLSGSLQYYSALPFNIVTGSNTIQGATARPLDPSGAFIPRNAGIGFDFISVNARFGRAFILKDRLRMEAFVEAFNALNHRNDMIPNGTFGSGAYPANPSSSFGQPTAVGDPRSLQLALRFDF